MIIFQITHPVIDGTKKIEKSLNCIQRLDTELLPYLVTGQGTPTEKKKVRICRS